MATMVNSMSFVVLEGLSDTRKSVYTQKGLYLIEGSLGVYFPFQMYSISYSHLVNLAL